MKKTSAVQWLIEKQLDMGIGLPKEWREQAKQMEKQQHGDTWDSAIFRNAQRGYNATRTFEDFDDYFMETFEK